MRIYLTLMTLLILASCTNDPKVKREKEATSDSSFHNDLDSMILKRQRWYAENLIPKHDLLIAFSYSPPTEEDKINRDKEFKEIRGYENKISKVETIQYPDSLVVTFYKRTKRACGIYGNLLVISDTVKLLFKDICSPFDRPTKRGEFYKFKYVIKASTDMQNKAFVPEEASLLNN